MIKVPVVDDQNIGEQVGMQEKHQIRDEDIDNSQEENSTISIEQVMQENEKLRKEKEQLKQEIEKLRQVDQERLITIQELEQEKQNTQEENQNSLAELQNIIGELKQQQEDAKKNLPEMTSSDGQVSKNKLEEKQQQHDNLKRTIANIQKYVQKSKIRILNGFVTPPEQIVQPKPKAIIIVYPNPSQGTPVTNFVPSSDSSQNQNNANSQNQNYFIKIQPQNPPRTPKIRKVMMPEAQPINQILVGDQQRQQQTQMPQRLNINQLPEINQFPIQQQQYVNQPIGNVRAQQNTEIIFSIDRNNNNNYYQYPNQTGLQGISQTNYQAQQVNNRPDQIPNHLQQQPPFNQQQSISQEFTVNQAVFNQIQFNPNFTAQNPTKEQVDLLAQGFGQRIQFPFHQTQQNQLQQNKPP